MKAYIKLILVTSAVIAVSFAVAAARAATPDVTIIVLPIPVLTDVLNYLAARPYKEVANLIGGMQRCLQDQVPDDKGNITVHGNCPEITAALRHMNTPLPHEPPAKAEQNSASPSTPDNPQ